MIKNKILLIKLKFDILCIKFKSIKVDIKFVIQKAYYKIFDHQKYQNLLQIEKNMQEILDTVDDHMKWL